MLTVHPSFNPTSCNTSSSFKILPFYLKSKFRILLKIKKIMKFYLSFTIENQFNILIDSDIL